jgi:transcriptional regulator GlxA family with amidase domain
MYASLERGYGSDNLGYANMCLWHYLSGFLYEEPFSLSENRSSRDAVEQSISHMRDNLSATLTLADLAGAVNLSASHYSAVFRKRTGYSPLEYFHHLKVQKACQYLLFTDMRIKEIAWAVGVEDPYYFSRMFSKLMGVAPQQYRLRRGG